MGLWFEELDPGRVIEHSLRRTVTEADNVLFSALTMNTQPLHLDEEFARSTEFGTRVVNSLFTLGLVVGMTVRHYPAELAAPGVLARRDRGGKCGRARDRRRERTRPCARRPR